METEGTGVPRPIKDVFPCLVCGQSFTTKQGLATHRTRMHKVHDNAPVVTDARAGKDSTQTIGANNDLKAEFREMTTNELFGNPFSDYFRLSFTIRRDRDEALALARKIEAIVAETLKSDVRVYVGVTNRK